MRILLMIHPEFLAVPSPDERFRIQEWLDRYQAALEARGHQVERFKSRDSKASSAEVIHYFSHCEGETWNSLRDSGRRVLVIPGVPGMPVRYRSASRRKILRGAAQFVLGLWQRRFPPVTADSFLACADAYLAPGEWQEILTNDWHVPVSRIHRLEKDFSRAAEVAEKALPSPGTAG